jgi:hypothetical protein
MFFGTEGVSSFANFYLGGLLQYTISPNSSTVVLSGFLSFVLWVKW